MRQVLDRSAWRDPAAYDRWEREMYALAGEMKRTTGRRELPPFGRWLRQASPGWPWHYPHLKAIRRALRRIESGEINRLMIFLHPRSYKSQMVTVRYPAYLLERDPMTRVIVGSYNQSLAESFSHETRRIVTERGVALDPKRQMVDEWWTAAGGGLKAVGVGGGITGRGGNCFTGETPVLTEHGYMRIDDLARMVKRPRVLAMNTETMTTEWRCVVAGKESYTDELVEIVTKGGHVIRCTPEHLIYTRSGYKPAGELGAEDETLVCSMPGVWRSEGQILSSMSSVLLHGASSAGEATAALHLSGVRRSQGQGVKALRGVLRGGAEADSDTDLRLLPDSIREARLRTREGHPGWEGDDFLQRNMLPAVSIGAIHLAPEVPELRPSDGRPARAILLGRVQDAGEAGAAVKAHPVTEDVSDVRSGVHTRIIPETVLLTAVRQQSPQPPDDRKREFPLQGRNELRQVVQRDEASHPGEGRLSVSRMLCDRGIRSTGISRAGSVAVEPSYPSYRRAPGEQRAGEPADAMPVLSHQPPQGRWDAVAGVRRLRAEGIPVYDIQVEGLHNFFAGDVLAHNCILLDDVVKSAAEVRSAAYRERVWAWWQSDIFSRQEPHPRTKRPASFILIMTRWSDDDLAGRILNGEGGDKWEILRIPALAETQDERDDYNAGIGRPAGAPDPLGREPGEAMNPERFDAATLADMSAEMGILPFMALYQQRPTAPGGDMFRREWFEIVPELPPGKVTAVRYWDKAGTAGGRGAYSAGVLMALVDGGNVGSTFYYVAHVVMGRWGSADREAIIRQTAAADFARFGQDVETVVEQEPGSGGKESAENTIRSLAGYRVAADRVTGDKVLRAEPYAAQASIGRVKLLQGEWNRDYLDILAAFPGGAIKDVVDASSGAFARLQQRAVERPKAAAPRVVGRGDIFNG